MSLQSLTLRARAEHRAGGRAGIREFTTYDNMHLSLLHCYALVTNACPDDGHIVTALF